MKSIGDTLRKIRLSPRNKLDYIDFIDECLEAMPDFKDFYYFSKLDPKDRKAILDLIDMKDSTTGAAKCPRCNFHTKSKYMSKHLYDQHDGLVCRLCKRLIPKDKIAHHRGECDISELRKISDSEEKKAMFKNEVINGSLGKDIFTINSLNSVIP